MVDSGELMRDSRFMENTPRRAPAEWRTHLRDDEREELSRAERMRNAASENLRVVTKRLKDRAIKRIRRSVGS